MCLENQSKQEQRVTDDTCLDVQLDPTRFLSERENFYCPILGKTFKDSLRGSSLRKPQSSG